LGAKYWRLICDSLVTACKQKQSLRLGLWWG